MFINDFKVGMVDIMVMSSRLQGTCFYFVQLKFNGQVLLKVLLDVVVETLSFGIVLFQESL